MKIRNVAALSASFVVACASMVSTAQAAPLVQTGSYNLASALAASPTNFNPIGIGFDASTNQLLFVQQGQRNIIRTNLTGGIVGTVSLGTAANTPGFGSTDFYYATSVAADANYYYVSDYTCNTNCYDVYRINKTTGAGQAISTETAAYGGTPLDVRNGLLYRTEASTTYGYNNIDQIRISALSSPDAILNTITLAQSGIGDFAIDTVSQSIFTLDYAAAAKIRRFSLLDGSLLETYDPTVDGLTAGLTYNAGTLYYYDHATSGSKLVTYAVSLPSGVPEPATWAMMLLGFGAMGGMLRRRQKVTARIRFA